MSYTTQSKNRNSKAEMNSIVTGGAISSQSPNSESGAFSPETAENK